MTSPSLFRRSLLALAMACASFSSQAQETRFKAVSFLPLNANFGSQFQRWINEVNKRGQGLIRIETVGPESMPAGEQANALKNGVVQMGFIAATYYVGTMWEGEVFPLGERPMKELRANGAWSYLDKLHREKLNAVLLGQIGDGVKMFIYTTKPIPNTTSERPFEGFSLRSVPIFKPFFESLGARTVTMPPGEVNTALDRNLVQGYGWPKWGIKDMGWLSATKYRYGPGFLGANTPILVNLNAWNALNEKQRQFLNEMATWLDNEWEKWRAERDQEEEKIQAEAGIKYVDMGPAFAKRGNDTRWAELEKYSPQHIPHLRKLMTR